ncbi:MAG: hypothetical protein M5U34_34320 [Chloroflexi bacterium]|nr:hypothetical protein [Chloroflexota bacterium]
MLAPGGDDLYGLRLLPMSLEEMPQNGLTVKRWQCRLRPVFTGRQQRPMSGGAAFNLFFYHQLGQRVDGGQLGRDAWRHWWPGGSALATAPRSSLAPPTNGRPGADFVEKAVPRARPSAIR